MKKFKIEVVETRTYVVDVLAPNEQMARKKVEKVWNKKIAPSGTAHYYEHGDTFTRLGSSYDVTNTDDPFDPIK